MTPTDELRDTIAISSVQPQQTASHKLTCSDILCLVLMNIPYLLILPTLFGFYVVEPMHSAVIMFMGRVVKVENRPGLHWTFLGFTIQKVPNCVKTLEIQNSKVPDSTGSPLAISVIVNYKIVEPIASLFYVDSYADFLHNQTLDVVQKVISKFPYISEDKSQPTLMNNRALIGEHMREFLQKKVEIAGLQVLNVDIMEAYYHPSVAQTLLQLQQAQAKLGARKILVEGAVNITKDIVDRAEKEIRVEFSNDGREKFVKDLLLILCSDHGYAQPVINV